MGGMKVPFHLENEEVAEILAYEFAENPHLVPESMTRSEIRAKVLDHYFRASEHCRRTFYKPEEPREWAEEIVRKTLGR